MKDENALEDLDLEKLLQELRVREQPELKETMRGVEEQAPLAEYDTDKIVESVINRQKVIYGVDNRQDLFSVTDQAIRASADSVVSLWGAADVVDNGNGTSNLTTQNFGTRLNLCNTEPFRNQPIGAFCSGFLVAPDIIATAGHCVNVSNLADIRFVFGYRMTNASDPQTVVNNSEIYQGTSIIGRQLTNAADWSLVRLDRRVTNHGAVSIRRTGVIPNNQAVYVIGHPSGLPIKYAPGSNVRDNTPAVFFVANLDTYGGNSGSPVFNANNHNVEGILVRGETDFVMNGTCRVSQVCPDTGCRGEDCTRTTQFSSEVPETVSLIGIQAACNNKYVCAEDAGNKPLIANRDWIRGWETFKLVDLGSGKIALQAVNGKYVCAEEGGNKPLIANRDWIRGWETFEYIDKDNNKFALKACNGKYVCAEDRGNKPLIANRDWVRGWETFSQIRI